MTGAPPRPATAEDREALADLWVEAWSAILGTIDFQARRPWFLARLDELEATGVTTLVGCDADGTPAGFVTVDPGSGYLDQLAVRPARQGGGLARRLMVEAKRLSPAGLDLHVNQDNPRAVRFYEREGFVVAAAAANPRSGLPVWHMIWRKSQE